MFLTADRALLGAEDTVLWEGRGWGGGGGGEGGGGGGRGRGGSENYKTSLLSASGH